MPEQITLKQFQGARKPGGKKKWLGFVTALKVGKPVAVPLDGAKIVSVRGPLLSYGRLVYGPGRVQTGLVDGTLYACLLPEAD